MFDSSKKKAIIVESNDLLYKFTEGKDGLYYKDSRCDAISNYAKHNDDSKKENNINNLEKTKLIS